MKKIVRRTLIVIPAAAQVLWLLLLVKCWPPVYGSDHADHVCGGVLLCAVYNS